MKKRGQITIFIIAGIIILLSVGIFLYIQSTTKIIPPTIVQIPPEVQPIHNYISDCVEQTTRDAIHLIGAQGGYITFPEFYEQDPIASIRDPFFDDARIPLWRVEGNTKIPSEDWMIVDIEDYVLNNIDECLLNLEPFRLLFELNEGEKNIEVELGETGVDVTMNWPVTARVVLKNQTYELKEYARYIPIRLKLMFELAKEVLLQENEDVFIEDKIIDLIAMDDDIPYTNTEVGISCSKKMWKYEEVKNKLKLLMEVNLPRIRVDKTSYVPIPEENEYEVNHYVMPVTETEYPESHVSFRYDPRWDTQLKITPSDSGLLSSEVQRGEGLAKLVCMNIWHFTYDLKAPVMVTVTDDETEGHEQFLFSYAFQTSIRKNVPSLSGGGSSIFEFRPRGKSDDWCLETRNLITVNTWENVTTTFGEEHNELPEVNITFTCIRFNCEMGQSDWQHRGAVVWLQERFPYCTNGIITGNKEGYEEKRMFVSTDQEKEVDLYLRPVSTLNVSVVKHYQLNPAAEEELQEEEIAVINVKIKGNDSYEADTFSPGGELKLLGKNDYSYELEIFLIDDRGIIGGYKGTWNPDWGQLETATEIKFHVIEWPYVDAELQTMKFAEHLSMLGNYSLSLAKPEIR